MATATKKPITINYWPTEEVLHSAARDWKSLPKPIEQAYESGGIIFLPKSIEIKTLEGWMTGNVDDVIIQGVKGELYPCKPDIFAATYDLQDPNHE